MDIQGIRLQQRQQQQQAIEQRNPGTYRIGDRDPVTGRTELMYPDGSRDQNGLKLYAAKHETGDRVLAQQRSDGAWLMSEANPAPNTRSPVSIFNDDRGYLEGRIFDSPGQDVKTSTLLLIQYLWPVATSGTDTLWTRTRLLWGDNEEIRVANPTEGIAGIGASQEPAMRLNNQFEGGAYPVYQQVVLVDLQVLRNEAIRDFEIEMECYWVGFPNDPPGPNPVRIQASLLADPDFAIPADGVVTPSAAQAEAFEVDVEIVSGVFGALQVQPVGRIIYSANRLEVSRD
jgi:hypothetical protein